MRGPRWLSTFDREDAMSNPLQPPTSLLVKLGSIAVHVEEMLSPNGHEFDRVVTQALISDPEVREWIKEMDALALMPKKRGIHQ